MSRTYLVFGGDEQDNLRILGPVKATSHEQAQDLAADEYPGHASYSSTPLRNWSARKFTERVVREWEAVAIPGQLTVDDILEEEDEEEDDLLQRAEGALAKAKGSEEGE